MSLFADHSTWTRVKFGEVIENVSDRVDDPSQAGVDRYIGLEHLDPGSMTITRWGTPDQVEAQKLRFRPGDVIFGRRRAYQKKVARADFEGICSAHALVLRAKPGQMVPDFLPAFLSSDLFLDRAVKISVGSLSPTVNWKTLSVQEFDLPSFEEQHRIAELLWACERHQTALRGLLEALESAADTLLASFIAGSREVRDVVSLARAGATPSRSRRDYYGGGIPWLKSGEVVGPSISVTEESLTPLGLASSSAHLVPAGATCVAMYGDGKTRGSVGRVTIPMATNQAVLALVADERVCDPEFLYLWMRSRSSNLRNKSAGGAQKNLNKALVIGEPFPDASLSEQLDAVARFRNVEEAQVLVDTELTHLIEMRRAFLSHLDGSVET